MQLLKYIWRNATRNKLRSMLTVLSVGFSLALMTVLLGYLAMQSIWGEESKKYNRIVVMNIQGFAGVLPIAHVDRIARIDGVKAVVPYAWFGGVYKDERMPFAQFGTFPDAVHKVWDEFRIDPAQLKAFQENRRACLVDRMLAERRGWRIGEKIPLRGTYYPVNLDLEMVGLFEGPQATESLWFNWHYLDESLRSEADGYGAGNSGTIFAKVESAAAIPRVSKAIDEQFASSENPTRTQTEAAFAQMFADMLGNVQRIVAIIGLVVMFALTLVAANAMAMSLRERTTEIAVLKAIGFPRGRVLGMMLGESCMIAGLGGIVGLAVGGLLLQLLHQASPQFFPYSLVGMSGPWMLLILVAAAAIGLVSGIVPAVLAAQASVIDGLRRVV